MSAIRSDLIYDPVTTRRLKLKHESLDKYRAGVRKLGFHGEDEARIFFRGTHTDSYTSVGMIDEGVAGWRFHVVHNIKDVYHSERDQPVEEFLEWIEHELPLVLFEQA